MSDQLGVDVEPVDTPKAAITDVDIAVTCTNTRSPVYFEEWLSPETFVTNTVPTELSDATYEAADRVVTTDNRPFQRYVIGDVVGTVTVTDLLESVMGDIEDPIDIEYIASDDSD